ncbi:MAG: hypothetical protein CMB80_26740 [Flammeovirgaceae bacterium]|nr:hypothetical protein [Flammeovirgaceae bacterium]|tara:strand:- start:2646 stop:3059 length:414 start_codon:yes stop_codon:yes gene_type:complete
MMQALIHLQNSSIWIAIPFTLLYAFLIWKYWYPSFIDFVNNFYRISYDTENLYVDQGTTELVVSFDRIKNVELVSFDGIYKFETFEKEVYYCKPSAWYPLNYSKVDGELETIRSLVKKYKQKFWAEQEQNNALPSNN